MSSAITAAVIVGGTSIYAASKSSKASEKAAQTQAEGIERATAAEVEATKLAIESQEKQLAQIQELLSPWVEAGTTALSGQLALAGLSGEAAQKQAIANIKSSPQYETLIQSGEEAILQNAAATGGLRGGNVQAALAEYRPSILSQLIENQYSKLSGITTTGQNAAAGVGSAQQTTGTNISNLLQSRGQSISSGITGGTTALAQGQLTQAAINAGLWGDLGKLAGQTVAQIKEW